MPWGYRRAYASSYRPKGGTSAWNTAGETASLKNACAQYGLSEEQVRTANIPCQWRSCHGNSYAVVKLSDVAALKTRLSMEAKKAKKAKMIEEMGEDGYAKHLDEQKKKQQKREASAKLVPLLEAAMSASGNGIAQTLDGMTISKTAAKSEWGVKPDEIEKLTPIDDTKKAKKYHLADVVGVAHNKSAHTSINGTHVSVRVKSTPALEKLYARYLHDKFNAQCTAVGDDDIVQSAYDDVRKCIERAVKSKADAVKEAQKALKIEETRLSAFDDIVANIKSNGGGEKKRSSSSKANAKENDCDKKPAAKKQKTTKKKGLAKNVEPNNATVREGGRARKAVNYAESDGE